MNEENILMSKNHTTDGILVFDRYYGRKPIPALLAVGRVLFCGLFSAAAMLYIFSQYELYVPLLNVGLYAGISAAVLSVLFIFVKRRYAIPALLLVSGLLIWHGFEEFRERFSYFVDEALLLVEGRFLFPRGYLIHDPNRLSPFNPDYCEGLLLGSFILCSLYGLLVAATMARRIRPLPAVLGFIALCVPMLLSERLELDMWLLPVALFIAAAVSISINYRDGLAVMRDGGASYRSRIREEDKQFLKNTERAGLLKRTGMRLSHYSKYATTGFYCAAVFALVYCIGTGIFEEGSSIDYSELYTFVTSFGDRSDTSTDEAEDSSVSDYFTSPEDEDDHLNIASPGRGNGEVLRVTFTGDKNIYLRGDIGVDFEDNSWTSPVSDNDYWGMQFLSEVYRPAELLITEALMQSAYAKDIGVESDISIEYLTQTDVVFLPAYTADHSFYSSESFDIYGDYVVRVSDSAENYINSVQCTAVTLDTSSHATAQAAVEEILDNMEFRLFRPDDFYGVMFPEFSNYSGILEDYANYVETRYSGVPEDMSGELQGYLESIGFYQQLGESKRNEKGIVEDQLYRFKAADFICRYLEKNYTYSLNGGNNGDDMIMKFLTETKKGHCSLYASAMTLLLREAGIPARYCTGFSIYPKSIDGNTTVLKEKNLHAWVEIYLDDIGWLTFDPTSAAVSGMGGQGNTPQRHEREETFQARPETREQIMPDNTEESVKPNETGEAPVPPTENKLPMWLLLTVIGAVLLTAAAVFAVVSWRSIAKRADEAVGRAASGSGRNIYVVTVDIIALCGIIPEPGQMPVDFYRSCDRRFGAGMERSTDVLEAAAFSSREPSEADRNELYRILREVYSYAMKQRGAVRKYRIRRLVISGLK